MAADRMIKDGKVTDVYVRFDEESGKPIALGFVTKNGQVIFMPLPMWEPYSGQFGGDTVHAEDPVNGLQMPVEPRSHDVHPTTPA